VSGAVSGIHVDETATVMRMSQPNPGGSMSPPFARQFFFPPNAQMPVVRRRVSAVKGAFNLGEVILYSNVRVLI
jgi:hypothetical protein